jgi:small conductance mechanosensitive channel
MSERARSAIITAGVGLAIVVVVRLLMKGAWTGYVARMESRRSPSEIAGQRTKFVILQRLVTTVLLVIVTWSVLEIFPATNALARSILASGAVLAIFVGIAVSGPLSNLGAGMLLGLSQSVRLGDRVTISNLTGVVVEISMMQTVLLTDEGRRIFVPNAQMASSIIVNRSIDDPRRIVSVRLPVAITASIEDARRTVLVAVDGFGGAEVVPEVTVAEVTEKTAWLSLSIHQPPGSDVAAVAAELRERALGALAREHLLPA